MKQSKTGFKHARLPICVTALILSFSFTGANDLQHRSENQKIRSAEAKLSPIQKYFCYVYFVIIPPTRTAKSWRACVTAVILKPS